MIYTATLKIKRQQYCGRFGDIDDEEPICYYDDISNDFVPYIFTAFVPLGVADKWQLLASDPIPITHEVSTLHCGLIVQSIAKVSINTHTRAH